MNATLVSALALASRALHFYLVSDVCIKDLTYEEMHIPLRELVCLLQNATSVADGQLVCDRPPRG